MTSSRRWKCDICYDRNDYPMIATCGHTFGQKCITGRLRCFTCNKLITTLIPNYYIGSANNLTYNQPNNMINNMKNGLFRFVELINKYNRYSMFFLFIFILHIFVYFESKNNINYEEKICNISQCKTIISINGIMLDITINSTNISQRIFMNTKLNNDYCKYQNILCYLKDNTILTLDNNNNLFILYIITLIFILALCDIFIIMDFLIMLRLINI